MTGTPALQRGTGTPRHPGTSTPGHGHTGAGRLCTGHRGGQSVPLVPALSPTPALCHLPLLRHLPLSCTTNACPVSPVLPNVTDPSPVPPTPAPHHLSLSYVTYPCSITYPCSMSLVTLPWPATSSCLSLHPFPKSLHPFLCHPALSPSPTPVTASLPCVTASVHLVPAPLPHWASDSSFTAHDLLISVGGAGQRQPQCHHHRGTMQWPQWDQQPTTYGWVRTRNVDVVPVFWRKK